MEPEFWSVIDRIVLRKDQSLASFIAEIDDERVLSKSPYGLASYLRVWTMRHLLDLQDIGSGSG